MFAGSEDWRICQNSRRGYVSPEAFSRGHNSVNLARLSRLQTIQCEIEEGVEIVLPAVVYHPNGAERRELNRGCTSVRAIEQLGLAGSCHMPKAGWTISVFWSVKQMTLH